MPFSPSDLLDKTVDFQVTLTFSDNRREKIRRDGTFDVVKDQVIVRYYELSPVRLMKQFALDEAGIARVNKHPDGPQDFLLILD